MPGSEPTILVVDIGGTKTSIALGHGTRVTNIIHFPSQHHQTATQLVDAIAQKGAGLAAEQHLGIDGVAVGVPGAVDPDAGMVLSAANLPLHRFPLAGALGDSFGAVPVSVENDANCGVMAEAIFGRARGFTDVVYLTLSTGVGVGIITSGRLLRGAHGTAGEIGHIQLADDGEPCGCGSRGCLEAYASGPAIAQRGRQLAASRQSPALAALAATPADVSVPHVAAAAERGDEGCREIVRSAATRLALALHILQRILDPQLILLGGGVMRNPWIADEVLQACVMALSKTKTPPHCAITSLGDNAVLLGALALWNAKHDPARRVVGLI